MKGLGNGPWAAPCHPMAPIPATAPRALATPSLDVVPVGGPWGDLLASVTRDAQRWEEKVAFAQATQGEGSALLGRWLEGVLEDE